jgi:hypothetical protein
MNTVISSIPRRLLAWKLRSLGALSSSERIVCWAALACLAAQGQTALPAEVAPIHLGSQKQLLFDHLFLEKSKGIRLRVNVPYQDPQPVLMPDRPWEGLGIGAYNTVMRDKGRFRMWYDALAPDEGSADVPDAAPKGSRRMVCYAESEDGIHWKKPDLGLIPYGDSNRTNIVAPPSAGANQQGASVFRDDRAPASERYKLWTKYHPSEAEQGKGLRVGLWSMVSPDGLSWKLLEEGYPLRRGNAADSQHTCFWDTDIGKYVGFVRMKVLRTTERQRTCTVGLLTSEDFRNWTQAQEVFRADEQIPTPAGVELDSPPFVDLYTPGGMKVPGVPNAYILLPTPYYHWRRDGSPSTIDVGLATSRDRIHWWRPQDPEPFLRLGLDGTANSGMLFANPWPIPVDDEIWIYYAGMGRDHTQRVREPSRTGIFRARIRRDGFVSADAGYRGGEFTTPVVTFQGDRLTLNMDGSAGGWLQVELLSPQGDPIAGFRQVECETIRGNSLDRVVTWQGRSDVSGLAGHPVRLRFSMRSMKLYAFQFGAESGGSRRR